MANQSEILCIGEPLATANHCGEPCFKFSPRCEQKFSSLLMASSAALLTLGAGDSVWRSLDSTATSSVDQSDEDKIRSERANA